MAKVKYIPCDIYKRGIWLFVGTLVELKSWVKKEFTYDDETDFVEMVLGLKKRNEAASFIYDNHNGQGVVHIYDLPKEPKEYATLAHELLHATFFVMNFCNVEYAYDGSNEPYTYLLEHLTRNALELEGYEEVEEKKKNYIRFGKIPDNEESGIYHGEEQTGKQEGVSVYPAIIDEKGNVAVGLSLPITATTLHTQQHLLEYDNRPCYLVTGDCVGVGVDGEPLLKNVKIVEEIKDYRKKIM
jgi:hypothetical protein